MLLTLQRALVVVVIALAAFAAHSYTAALYEAERERQRADLEAMHRAGLQRVIAQAEALAREDADLLFTAASEAQAREQRQRTATRIATRVVAQKPDYRSCRLDACGLCLARAAAADTDPANCPCPGDGPLPATTGAQSSDGGSAARLHRSGRTVQPVPGAPSDAE